MECQVCFDTKKAKDLLKCEQSACQVVVCATCIATFGKAQCAACGVAWTAESMQTKKFPKLRKAYQEDLLWAREKSLMPQAKEYLDWTILCEEASKKRRFGIFEKVPTKPKTNLSIGTVKTIACPTLECRGFVTRNLLSLHGACGLCKANVCLSCEDLIQGAQGAHTCKPDVLESLQLLRKDTRDCPQCFAKIAKTMGCNHMICTNCRNHFDWATGKPLKVSTNGHQNSTKVFNANPNLFRAEMSLTCEIEDMKSDAIPERVFQEKFAKAALSESSMVLKTLYTDIAHVRFTFQTKQANMRTKFHDDRMNLRVKYLRSLVSEDEFKSKMLHLEDKSEFAEHEAELLIQIISLLNDLQYLVFYDKLGMHEALSYLQDVCESFDKHHFKFQWTSDKPFFSL